MFTEKLREINQAVVCGIDFHLNETYTGIENEEKNPNRSAESTKPRYREVTEDRCGFFQITSDILLTEVGEKQVSR